MTVGAIAGLVALNALVLLAGSVLLWAVRGLASWGELVRLSGLAYMTGVAALGVALTVELVMGVPFSIATVLLTLAALAAAGLASGRVAQRPLPARGDVGGAKFGVVGVMSVALLAVFAEALFRAGRLKALSAWDAWAFWVAKAKGIYLYGGLDEQFFRELPNAIYPPLLPALEASAFAFMGSADVVTLHLQLWFFFVGFVAAIAGLLAPRVPPLLLWPILLVVLVAPRVASRALEPQADFLLDYFVALGALLLALWLVERSGWQLLSATLFLAAAMLTKREGLLLTACALVAALAASWSWRRLAWPRLVAVGLCAFALTIPWRIWFTSRDLSGELPTAGVLGVLDHTERAWPAVDSVVSIAFDPGLWLVSLPLALVAAALAYLGGARILPTYVSLLYGLALAGFVWVLWSYLEIELPFVQDEGVNPMARLAGSLAFLSSALVPLLLAGAWRGTDDEGGRR